MVLHQVTVMTKLLLISDKSLARISFSWLYCTAKLQTLLPDDLNFYSSEIQLIRSFQYPSKPHFSHTVQKLTSAKSVKSCFSYFKVMKRPKHKQLHFLQLSFQLKSTTSVLYVSLKHHIPHLTLAENTFPYKFQVIPATCPLSNRTGLVSTAPCSHAMPK